MGNREKIIEEISLKIQRAVECRVAKQWGGVTKDNKGQFELISERVYEVAQRVFSAFTDDELMIVEGFDLERLMLTHSVFVIHRDDITKTKMEALLIIKKHSLCDIDTSDFLKELGIPYVELTQEDRLKKKYSSGWRDL